MKFTPNGCVVTAHDAKTGKELWRTRLIPRKGEPGDETWGGMPDAARRHVGAWMVPSYDAATNQLIFGTSVTSPAPKYKLAGNDKQYLYHNSTLALNGTRARSTGITSTSSITGIWTIRLSGCCWTPRSRPIRPKLRGSIPRSRRASVAAWSRVSPARRVSSIRWI
ncbi:MAG: hypothetical protein WDO18_07770 [Acidobacteriota bacterium]